MRSAITAYGFVIFADCDKDNSLEAVVIKPDFVVVEIIQRVEHKTIFETRVTLHKPEVPVLYVASADSDASGHQWQLRRVLHAAQREG